MSMTKNIGEIEIWKQRSDKFNNISWVTDKDLLRFIEWSLQLNGTEKILHAGIGTGILAKYLIDKVDKVYGLDCSKEMMSHINDDRIITRIGDFRSMPFEDNFFDRVIFRHALHHCVGYTSLAIDEAIRVLKPGGKIIVCESVPISDKCVSDFSQIVTLKENRLVFTAEDLVRLIYKFKNIFAESIILKQQSIANWVDNCVEDRYLKARIFSAHFRASDTYKKEANMVNKDNDILVDMKFVVVRGDKDA